MEEEHQNTETQTDEEYKVWKKNSPFLYDLVVTNSLEWPSLTVEWMKKRIAITGKDYTEEQLVIGTHTTEGEQNYLMIANVKLPKPNIEVDTRHYDEERGELGNYGGQKAKFKITIRINHDGEVNRARVMPQDDLFVATKTVSGEINIFDISKHPSMPSTDALCCPNLKLFGHESEGYGIDWNPNSKGQIVSCADDSSICVFDVQKNKTHSKVSALKRFNDHDGVVGDVEWHKFDSHVFGSVGDDKHLRLWDLRTEQALIHASRIHDSEINALSFSPLNEYLLVTGGTGNVVKLWDMRKLSSSLHEFEGHTGNIVQLQFSPHTVGLFASCAEDKRVILWDIARIGEEQSPEDAEDGPSEMLFSHGGHTGKTSDFNWNKNDEWLLASVAEDNVLHVWKPSETICYEESLADIVEKMNQKDITK